MLLVKIHRAPFPRKKQHQNGCTYSEFGIQCDFTMNCSQFTPKSQYTQLHNDDILMLQITREERPSKPIKHSLFDCVHIHS